MNCSFCTTPRPDCMGMLISSIGNGCAAMNACAAQAAVSASVAAAAAGPREAHPVGNTGTTSQPLPVRHGAALPALFGASHRG